MSIRVITIDENFPQHWDHAKHNGFWDLQKKWKALAKGDVVYFWVTGTPGHVIGRAIVTTEVEDLAPGAPHAWAPSDPRRGGYTHRIGLRDFHDLDVKLNWGDVRAHAGAGGRLNPVTAIPDGGAVWFEEQMGISSADPFEEAVAAVAPDTYWEGLSVEVITEDRRERVALSVVIRRGRRDFRDGLLTAFDRRCAVTGCAVVELLEAAHISPYRGDHTDLPENGLLLRSDIHTLFDLHLLTVKAEDLTIAVSPSVTDPLYRALHGQRLRARADGREADRTLLRKHNEQCTWLQRTEQPIPDRG